MDLKEIRKNYSKLELSLDEINHPLDFFKKWLNEAKNTELEPTAMILSTCIDLKVSSRVVLLKEIIETKFIFFSNYQSQKGEQISRNPIGSLLFFWPSMERQVRIEGIISKTSRKYSEEYFYSRPIESQIGAIISDQSQPVKDKSELEARKNNFILNPEKIMCPTHWGGYGLEPNSIEFWQGRPSRLHNRVQCQNINGKWQLRYLQP